MWTEKREVKSEHASGGRFFLTTWLMLLRTLSHELSELSWVKECEAMKAQKLRDRGKERKEEE